MSKINHNRLSRFKDLDWTTFCSFNLSVSHKHNWGRGYLLVGRDSNLYLWTSLVKDLAADKDRESDSAAAKELIGVVVSPTDVGSLASITYISGEASGGYLRHYFVAVTSRGKVIVLTATLLGKRPWDMIGCSWSYFVLAPRLSTASQFLTRLGVISTASENLVVVISGGKLHLMDLDVMAPATRYDLVMKTFVESAVFRIPGSDTFTGDMLNLRISPKRDALKMRKTKASRQDVNSSPSRQQQSRLSKLSLFELAALKPKEKRLNSKVLRSFLDKHGKNPPPPQHSNDFPRPVSREISRFHLALFAPAS